MSLLARTNVSELDVSVSLIHALFDHVPVFGYVVNGLLGDWHRDGTSLLHCASP